MAKKKNQKLDYRAYYEDSMVQALLKDIEGSSNGHVVAVPPLPAPNDAQNKKQFQSILSATIARKIQNPERPIVFLVPVSTGGHWVGARVCLDEQNNISVQDYTDSLQEPNPDLRKAIIEATQTTLESIGATVKVQKKPVDEVPDIRGIKQENGYDCGPYLAFNLGTGLQEDKAPSNGIELRKAQAEKLRGSPEGKAALKDQLAHQNQAAFQASKLGKMENLSPEEQKLRGEIHKQLNILYKENRTEYYQIISTFDKRLYMEGTEHQRPSDIILQAFNTATSPAAATLQRLIFKQNEDGSNTFINRNQLNINNLLYVIYDDAIEAKTGKRPTKEVKAPNKPAKKPKAAAAPTKPAVEKTKVTKTSKRPSKPAPDPYPQPYLQSPPSPYTSTPVQYVDPYTTPQANSRYQEELPEQLTSPKDHLVPVPIHKDLKDDALLEAIRPNLEAGRWYGTRMLDALNENYALVGSNAGTLIPIPTLNISDTQFKESLARHVEQQIEQNKDKPKPQIFIVPIIDNGQEVGLRIKLEEDGTLQIQNYTDSSDPSSEPVKRQQRKNKVIKLVNAALKLGTKTDDVEEIDGQLQQLSPSDSGKCLMHNLYKGLIEQQEFPSTPEGMIDLAKEHGTFLLRTGTTLAMARQNHYVLFDQYINPIYEKSDFVKYDNLSPGARLQHETITANLIKIKNLDPEVFKIVIEGFKPLTELEKNELDPSGQHKYSQEERVRKALENALKKTTESTPIHDALLELAQNTIGVRNVYRENPNFISYKSSDGSETLSPVVLHKIYYDNLTDEKREELTKKIEKDPNSPSIIKPDKEARAAPTQILSSIHAPAEDLSAMEIFSRDLYRLAQEDAINKTDKLEELIKKYVGDDKTTTSSLYLPEEQRTTNNLDGLPKPLRETTPEKREQFFDIIRKHRETIRSNINSSKGNPYLGVGGGGDLKVYKDSKNPKNNFTYFDVETIVPGGPLSMSGVKPGDKITEVGMIKLNSSGQIEYDSSGKVQYEWKKLDTLTDTEALKCLRNAVAVKIIPKEEKEPYDPQKALPKYLPRNEKNPLENKKILIDVDNNCIYQDPVVERLKQKKWKQFATNVVAQSAQSDELGGAYRSLRGIRLSDNAKLFTTDGKIHAQNVYREMTKAGVDGATAQKNVGIVSEMQKLPDILKKVKNNQDAGKDKCEGMSTSEQDTYNLYSDAVKLIMNHPSDFNIKGEVDVSNPGLYTLEIQKLMFNMMKNGHNIRSKHQDKSPETLPDIYDKPNPSTILPTAKRGGGQSLRA